jgi:hypothetical protein
VPTPEAKAVAEEVAASKSSNPFAFGAGSIAGTLGQGVGAAGTVKGAMALPALAKGASKAQKARQAFKEIAQFTSPSLKPATVQMTAAAAPAVGQQLEEGKYGSALATAALAPLTGAAMSKVLSVVSLPAVTRSALAKVSQNADELSNLKRGITQVSGKEVLSGLSKAEKEAIEALDGTGAMAGVKEAIKTAMASTAVRTATGAGVAGLLAPEGNKTKAAVMGGLGAMMSPKMGIPRLGGLGFGVGVPTILSLLGAMSGGGQGGDQ